MSHALYIQEFNLDIYILRYHWFSLSVSISRRFCLRGKPCSVIQLVPVNGLISLNCLIIKANYAILPADFGFGTEFDIRIRVKM